MHPIIPVIAAPLPAARRMQRRRRLMQATFYLLFIFAPVFNLFRVDLYADHAWLLGFEWRLGLDAFQGRGANGIEAGLNIVLRLIVPVFALGGMLIFVAMKWGRLFCGWVCPHFPLVEWINALVIRASGKAGVWESQSLPATTADGRTRQRDWRWWPVAIVLAIALAFSWAVVLLTYVLPPAEIYGNIWHGTPTRNQAVFLGIMTLLLSLDFLFARHLFCRYMCSVGLFQSLAWMKNPRALVVGFDRSRASSCSTCLPEREAACIAVCPMRLKPRSIKRHMFSCTQCALCLGACAETQQKNPDGPLLKWVSGKSARQNEAGFSASGTSPKDWM